VIMVGEIRDRETAEIAIQAALTGHLVLSTLHTNNAASAVTRLIEMDIQPFLISSTILGVIAQRLIRKICSDCRTPYTASDQDLQNLRVVSTEAELVGSSKVTLYRGQGCMNCKKTGYRGRNGIFEMLVPDRDIRKLILSKASSEQIETEATGKGMINLREDGLLKIKAGITTLDEVLRATQEVSS